MSKKSAGGSTPVPNLISDAFKDPIHKPFTFTAGKSAALLIHGFLGTPSEVRPLGRVLHKAGWTVHAPTLPGSGTDMPNLVGYKAEDFVNAVVSAIDSLHTSPHGYETKLVIGHSLGGTLALIASIKRTVPGAILIAPFLKFAEPSPILNALWHLLKPFLKSLHPFRYMDVTSPEIARFIHRFRPDLDLHDESVQLALRSIVLPVKFIREVENLGRAALKTAASSRSKILILQGDEDVVAPPGTTRILAKSLNMNATYNELPGPHYIIQPDHQSWSIATEAIQAFANQFLD